MFTPISLVCGTVIVVATTVVLSEIVEASPTPTLVYEI